MRGSLDGSAEEPSGTRTTQAWQRALQAEKRAEAGNWGRGCSQDWREAWLEVADHYARLEQLLPDDHRLAANRGHALWIADRPSAALEAYQRAVQLAPSDPVVYRGLGNVHLDRQNFEAAERSFQQSLRLEPSPQTSWNYSQLLIGLERYGAGYEMAEARWFLNAYTTWRDPSGAWSGEPEGWTAPLLIWSEQGLGDTLQHLRWIGPLVRRRGARSPALVMEVEPSLVGLLRQGMAHLRPRLRVRPKPASGPEPWEYAHVSLLSLPRVLGGAPWPEGASSLQVDQWAPVRPWPPVSAPLRVGLVWAAGCKLEQPATAREYWRRSLEAEALGRLITGLADRGVACTLLQFGVDREEADPWRRDVAAELPEDADFAATAAVVAEQDLVITVDTAMAHLVGAMGRRGWVLLPFSAAPRWLRRRSDSPWYPTLRLFRQPQTGDWASVVEEVLQALDVECSAAAGLAVSPSETQRMG